MKQINGTRTWIACGALALAHAGIALGGLSQSAVSSPGGFIQCVAGPTGTGGGTWPGADWTVAHTGGSTVVNEQAFSGVSTVTQAADYSAGSITNSAVGTAGMGWLKVSANNSAPTSALFPSGGSNGGWKDTFLINSPGHAGQTGYMQFTVHVTGTLFASGPAGSASLTVTAYKDNIQLLANSLANPGNSDLLSTDGQYGHWAIATYGSPPTDSKTVDGIITFAVPITFGTPFSLGVYGLAVGGMRASGGNPNISTAESDFSNTITWSGITNVYLGTAPIADYTISASSGIDWGGAQQPPAPEDLNGDGLVDGADLGLLLGSWGPCSGCPEDLNGDGTVDGADLGMLLGAWS